MNTCHAELTSEEKEILIDAFHGMYFNTGQDSEEFASEFFFLVGAILSGAIPLTLEKLSDFENAVLEEIPRLEKYYANKEDYITEETEE